MTQVEIHLANSTITRDSCDFGRRFFTEDMARAAFDQGKYDKVAAIDFDGDTEAALEYAFATTQNVHDAWNKAAPCRSSMVGDIFVVDGMKYAVGRIGFCAL